MNTMNIPFAERLWYALRQHGYEVNVQKGGYAAYVGAPDSPAICIMDGDGCFQMCRSPKIGCVEQLCMMEGIQNVYRMVKDSALNPLHLPGLKELDVESEGNLSDDRQIMMCPHCPIDSPAPNECDHEDMMELNPIAGLLSLLFGAPSALYLTRIPRPDSGGKEDESPSDGAPDSE